MAALARARALSLLLLLLTAGVAGASETGLSGAEGHPRSRFPLGVWLRPIGDPALDAAVADAVRDWNTLFTQCFGVAAFTPVTREADAEVTVAVESRPAAHRMGETSVEIGAGGVITPPVRIEVYAPGPRGQTDARTVLYQIVAHELGHALGLEHVDDPRSLMCCTPGGIDFHDPAVREAYVEARRHPSVASVRAQLLAHYGRFWHERG